MVSAWIQPAIEACITIKVIEFDKKEMLLLRGTLCRVNPMSVRDTK
jgi:hypothetical protein